MRRLLPVLTIGALLATQPGRLAAAFDYEVAADVARCPAKPEVQAEVNRRLGYTALGSADAERTVLARIGRGPEGLVATVWVVHRPEGKKIGRRSIASAAGDCAALAEALALAISIAIDPVAALDAPPAVPGPPPPPPPAAPDPLELEVGLALVSSWGLTPGFSSGLVLRGTAHLIGISLALEARGDLPFRVASTLSRDGVPLTATAAGCMPLGGLAPCLSLTGGAVVFGPATLSGAPLVAPVAAAGLRLQAQHRVSEWLFLHGALDAQATLARIRFVSGEADVWTPPPVRISAQVGASWRVP